MSPRTLRLFSISGLLLAFGMLFFWWLLSSNESKDSMRTSNQPAEINTPDDVPRVVVDTADTSVWARRLAARSDANDLGSIVETFKESGNCLEYFVARSEIASTEKDARLDDLSRETKATLDSIDANLDWSSSVLEQTTDFCSGANEESVARAYMASLLKAALMGDADAQSCFVISGAQIPSPEVMRSGRYNKYLENRYLKHAPAFTQRALERNDPRVAIKAVRRYIASPPVHSSRLGNLPLPDPYLTWRAARLASLRALPEQRPLLEDILETFEKLNLISPEDLKRGDAWAKATYERDFATEEALNFDRHGSCYSLK